MPPVQEKYAFTRQFEAFVAVAEATSHRFHDLIGHALEPERMPSEDAKLLTLAAQAVAAETGAGCPSAVIAVQHLRTMCDQGKLSHAQVSSAHDLVVLADDLGGVPDLDALIAKVSPVVRRLAQRDAINDAIKDYGKGAGIEDALQALEKVAALGRQRGSIGQRLSGTKEDILSVVAPSRRSPMQTGVQELDNVLEGGMERGALGMVMAATGGGKSLFLCHMAAQALIDAYSVAYMTLELSESQVKKRVYSNLMDMTQEEMAKDPDEAARRFRLHRLDGAGNLFVIYETPRATTPATLRRWLRAIEAEHGFRPELIIVDYADKMVASLKSKDQQRRAYEEMEIVYEDLRSIAVERDGWVWTASQTNKGGLHKRKVDLEHTADSVNKPRVCDLVVAIARTSDDEENGMIRFRVPKRRENAAHQEVGPLVMDAPHGRITMVARNSPWLAQV